MHKAFIVSAILMASLTPACGAASAPPPEAASSNAGEPSSTPTSPPSATPPTQAEDKSDLKRALVTAEDLGKPWIAPKTVNRDGGKKGEVCPGRVSAMEKLNFTANASTDLTEGKGTGRNIASYRIKTLPDEEVTAVAAAIRSDQKACARYSDAVGFKVIRSAEGPTSVDGAEVLAAWAERVYYVKPHKLAYARHYVVAHQGRVLTSVSYAFLTNKKDSEAKDFSKATRLLQVQLEKNATVFNNE